MSPAETAADTPHIAAAQTKPPEILKIEATFVQIRCEDLLTLSAAPGYQSRTHSNSCPEFESPVSFPLFIPPEPLRISSRPQLLSLSPAGNSQPC